MDGVDPVIRDESDAVLAKVPGVEGVVVLEFTSRRYSAPYRDVIRARIVLLAGDRQENTEIARRLDLPVPIVSKWRKRFFEAGLAGLAERSRTGRGPGSPPALVVAVKAIACELPARLGLPLIRLHVPDIRAEVIRRGLFASLSDTTIWRWLSEDAIKPWTHCSWIFPRDPDFGAKAARVLDLYTEAYPRLVPVHLPVHASWLNHVEIYFTPPNATGTSSRVGCAN